MSTGSDQQGLDPAPMTDNLTISGAAPILTVDQVSVALSGRHKLRKEARVADGVTPPHDCYSALHASEEGVCRRRG